MITGASVRLRPRELSQEVDIVLLASTPGYPDTSEVQLTREVWPTVRAVVHSVTIVLESGASPTASGLFLAYDSADSPTLCLPRATLGVLRVGVQLYGGLPQ